MKKLLLILGAVAVIGGVLLIVVLFTAAHIFHEAEGRGIYSGIGAWTRIQEFAHEQGKTNYIAEADRKMAFLQQMLGKWQEHSAGQDLSGFEKMKATAYETTDKNIKNGLNPLAYVDVRNSLQEPPTNAAEVSTNK